MIPTLVFMEQVRAYHRQLCDFVQQGQPTDEAQQMFENWANQLNERPREYYGPTWESTSTTAMVSVEPQRPAATTLRQQTARRGRRSGGDRQPSSVATRGARSSSPACDVVESQDILENGAMDQYGYEYPSF